MSKLLKRVLIIILSLLLIYLAFIHIGLPIYSCYKESKYYVIPEYVSSKTEEEHFAEISKRADEILCEQYGHGDSVLYDYVLEMVYNFKEEPQFFVIYFSYGEGVFGAVINDEYYVLSREGDIDNLWKDLGNTQSRKYYNGTKYNLKDGKLLNLGNNTTLTEEEYQSIKNKTPKIYVFDSENLQRYESLEDMEIFKRADDDFYQLYFLPDYSSSLTEEVHKQKILSRSQNKFNELATESNYINVKAELMPSFDNRLMYFMVTYTAEDVIVNGEKLPNLYDVGIIINDEYYLLYSLSSKDNLIHIKENNAETEQKYYGNPCVFNQEDYKLCGVYAVKESDEFYQLTKMGKVKMTSNLIPTKNYYSVKVKNIYNPTVADAFTVYQT